MLYHVSLQLNNVRSTTLQFSGNKCGSDHGAVLLTSDTFNIVSSAEIRSLLAL